MYCFTNDLGLLHILHIITYVYYALKYIEVWWVDLG